MSRYLPLSWLLLTAGLFAGAVSSDSAATEQRKPRQIFPSETRLDTPKDRIQQRSELTVQSAQPEVWLCAGDRIADLLRPEAEWSFVRQHLSGIKLYVGQLSRNRRASSEAVPDRLRQLVRLVNAHRLQVAVELGGCLDFSPMDDTAGEWSARHELASLENFYAAGGRVDYLDLDGPIRRLLHPEKRRDGKRFDSIEQAADELVDALRIHRAAHPETKYWLLTNFPNWGWRGDVSYHARGPQRQDYGDYDQVVRIVLEKLRAAEIPLDGVTVDNPYEYLVGDRRSVNLPDPKSVDWLGRVRSYEEFAREQGLTFNLIVNSELGGHESDERFFRDTLQMVDVYRRAGGRPTRWFVQSWYPHPKQMEPETAPHSMTALVRSVIERVRDAAVVSPELPAVPGDQREPGFAGEQARESPPDSSAAINPLSDEAASATSGAVPPAEEFVPDPQRAAAARAGALSGTHSAAAASNRIALQPQAGAMQVTARVPALNNQAFALGIPETIGCREAMLVNFPEARIEWQGPDERGAVACSWGPGGRISYTLRLVPAEDFVDVEMTIRNHTEFFWRDVFAFNCLNPIGAPSFQDWKLERTYMSRQGQPYCLAQTTRVRGSMPTVGFYLPERVAAGEESVFVRGFRATSPDRTDGSWIVTLSDTGAAYMAATAVEAAFLFDNLDRCCLHAAPSFGDIGPGEASSAASRFYVARGTLDEFLQRLEADRSALAGRQKWARPEGAVSPGKSPEHRLEPSK